jgi:protocatechuate 3,4-dioxygenase beta subunit
LASLVGRTVIAGGGGPVAGVRVEGIPVEDGSGSASTRTDEEGRFRIEGLGPGRYRVEATSEGREGYSQSSITLAMGETSPEVVIELDPAYVVRGRVIDKATGEPCQSGQVVITDPTQNEYSQAAIQPDGWARMASVIPGTYQVEVRCKDHVERDDYPPVTVIDRDAPSLTWEVDRGATVRVEVVDGQGRPVSRARVWAHGDETKHATGADHVEPDGTFLLAGLKPGDYRVSVNTDIAQGSANVTAGIGREERVKVELSTSGVIEGRVEDDAHRPVPSVQVVASGPSGESTFSNEDGTFFITGLLPGQYEVRPVDRRGAEGARETDPTRVVKVTLAAQERARVTLTVASRAAVIEGLVVDGAGQPVTDAFVDFMLAEGSSFVPRFSPPGQAPVVTDTQGRFTLSGLAEGVYNLRAYRQGGMEVTAFRVKSGTWGLLMQLGEGGSIAGTLAVRGSPVERFSLIVRDHRSGFTRSELFFHAGGAFVVHDLPAATYDVDAITPAGTATAEVTLAEGERKGGVALALAQRTTVDGQVVDQESGAPLAGARLGLMGGTSLPPMIGVARTPETGPDGRFHLEGVLPGKWALIVTRPDTGSDMNGGFIVVPEGGSDIGVVRVPRYNENQD